MADFDAFDGRNEPVSFLEQLGIPDFMILAQWFLIEAPGNELYIADAKVEITEDDMLDAIIRPHGPHILLNVSAMTRSAAQGLVDAHNHVVDRLVSFYEDKSSAVAA
jgi:hypothetical protein